MIANLGYGSLFITFLVSLYGVGAAAFGQLKKAPKWVDSARWVESARSAMLLTFPLLTISTLSLVYLLTTGHYEINYVAQVTSDSMPFYLKITALWGGQAGSLLFWSWLMAAFASAVTLRKWDRDREFLPWVIIIALVTLAFFLLLVLFVENPFAKVWMTKTGLKVAMLQPSGGVLTLAEPHGLNPLLRHYGMVFHPPMLYLGFVSFVIPYAFAMAALITGRSDDRWIRITRRWTLVAWLFLSMGLILGMRWAYDVLGWGGYWGWDPAEVAALIPWLVGTPFLHSVVIQEKRGMLKRWNMILITLTFEAMIFSTFFIRSGLLSSVHAFAQSAIGPLMFGFIILTLIGSMLLLARRWDSLKSEAPITSFLSRETFFLLNNLGFLSLFIVCALGILFPILTESLGVIGQKIPALSGVFTGQKVTVGPAWYEAITGPLWGAVFLLLGICPLAAWGHSTIKTLGRSIWKPTLASLAGLVLAVVLGVHQPLALLALWLVLFAGSTILYEYGRSAWARHRMKSENIFLALWQLAGRNRRRYGGHIIHLGVVLIALGIIGIEMFQSETQGSLPQGGQLTLGQYTIRYDQLDEKLTSDGILRTVAEVSLYKNGHSIGTLYPRRDYYFDSQQPMTIPGLRSTLEDDLYVVLVDWEPISEEGATFKVYHNPLVNWVWIGGMVLILGTLVGAWPEREKEEIANGE